MNDFATIWKRLKSWHGAVWLPVLPPWLAVLELVVLLALIAGIDWAMPTVDVAALEPSPYWIPVLLLSLQYGTVAGLLAAAAASVVYALNGFPEQVIGENLFTYYLRIWALPMLWVIVALLIGQFRLRQIELKQDLKRDLKKRTLEAEAISGYAKTLEKRCAALEQQASVRTAMSGAQAVEALGVAANPAVALDLALQRFVQAALPGAAVSIFGVTPSGADMAASAGWPASATWLRRLDAQHPLFRALVNERRAFSVLKRGEERALGSEGIAAVPVVTADGSRTVGLIKVEHALPEQITPGLTDVLAVLARAVAPRLAEPHVIVDNTAAPADSAARLTSGWKHQSWSERRASGAEAALKPDAGPGEAAPAERSPRPSFMK